MDKQGELIAALTGGAPANKFPIAKLVLGTDPAANVEISETVPAAKAWELIAFTVVLVQGATQTPLPSLVIDDGTTAYLTVPGASAALNASVTSRFTWAQGQPLTGGAALTINTAPLPPGVRLILPAGYRIKTSTSGIGANSNYGAPTLSIIEYA